MACVATTARKNARIESETLAEVVVVKQVADKSTSGGPPLSDARFFVELDLQWAFPSENGSGMAVQWKLSTSILLPTLDLYYALGNITRPLYLGFGVELGPFPSAYGVATLELDDLFYVSVTPRLLRTLDYGRAYLFSPQLSLGLTTKKADVSLFASYAQGQGFNFSIAFDSEYDDRERTEYWLLGASVRFLE